MDEIKKLEIGDATVYNHDSGDMSCIPDESVNLIITSPPYWTLKDYDVEGQIGSIDLDLTDNYAPDDTI